MKIIALKSRSFANPKTSWGKKWQRLDTLLNDLRSREVPTEIVEDINSDLQRLNTFEGNDKSYIATLNKVCTAILKRVGRDMNLIPKGHYQTLWMSLGMAALGMPIGMAMGFGMNNLAFIGIGLPIGLSMGIFIGATLDGKAKKEGRQLPVSAA